jgi:ubiquinone/menaquinone biosynthesis C-methylase UbiE
MTIVQFRGAAEATPTDRAPGFQLADGAARRYERAVGEFMLAWSADLIERVAPERGERILDLACGTGFVARLAAAAVGNVDDVIGVDINPSMVAEARRVTALRIVEAPAEATGLPDESFDVVFCQQGLQYVSDPAAVLRETARLLRPGGRVAMSVWAGFERNPFRRAQLASMAAHLTAQQVEAYEGTTVDALGGTSGLAAHLRGAGLDEVVVVERDLDVVLPPMRAYFPSLIAATPWAERFEELAPEQRRTVTEVVEASATPGRDAASCTVRMSVAIAVGVRSRRG